jgi:hypothetical protein
MPKSNHYSLKYGDWKFGQGNSFHPHPTSTPICISSPKGKMKVHKCVRQGCHNGRPTVKITVRTSARVRIYPTDAVLPADGFLLSARMHSFPSSPLPCGCSLLSARTGCVRTDATASKKIKIIFLFFFIFLVVVAGLKRENFFFRFSVLNPQDPRPSRAKPREEEGFFGLVPLVTHPSSIPLLGCLTPKFLSLSLHSL